MSESAYLKLVDRTRLVNYLGMEMEEGYKHSAGPEYIYAEIPILGVRDEEGQLHAEVKRNQHVFVQAAASINVRGRSFCEVEPNAALSEYGQVQGLYRIHPGTGRTQLGFWFTARKDTDLKQFTHAVRLYMPS